MGKKIFKQYLVTEKWFYNVISLKTKEDSLNE